MSSFSWRIKAPFKKFLVSLCWVPISNANNSVQLQQRMKQPTLILQLSSLSLKENEAENHSKYAPYVRAFNLLPRNAVCRSPPEKAFHLGGDTGEGWAVSTGKQEWQRAWLVMLVLFSNPWCRNKIWVPCHVKKGPLCAPSTAAPPPAMFPNTELHAFSPSPPPEVQIQYFLRTSGLQQHSRSNCLPANTLSLLKYVCQWNPQPSHLSCSWRAESEQLTCTSTLARWTWAHFLSLFLNLIFLIVTRLCVSKGSGKD